MNAAFLYKLQETGKQKLSQLKHYQQYHKN